MHVVAFIVLNYISADLREKNDWQNDFHYRTRWEYKKNDKTMGRNVMKKSQWKKKVPKIGFIIIFFFFLIWDEK